MPIKPRLKSTRIRPSQRNPQRRIGEWRRRAQIHNFQIKAIIENGQSRQEKTKYISSIKAHPKRINACLESDDGVNNQSRISIGNKARVNFANGNSENNIETPLANEMYARLNGTALVIS